MCIGAILFESIGINSHFGILFAGIVGLFLYKRKYPLNFAEQIRNYDVKIPLIVTLVNLSCCEFCSSLFGLIASQFI